MNLNNSFLGKFFPIWLGLQTKANEVFRWKEFYSDGIGQNMREQSVLGHEKSFSRFAGTACRMLDPYIFKKEGKHLDLLLLKESFGLHDDGEWILGRDIISPKKTDQDDVDEYIAFIQNIKDLPVLVKKEYEKAFLLQFTLDNNFTIGGSGLFPKSAEKIMDRLFKENYYEALIFSALEKLEYVFYPIEMEKNHKYLLTWVIRKRITYYQNLALSLPGFREELFSFELEEEFLKYLKEHEHVPEFQF